MAKLNCDRTRSKKGHKMVSRKAVNHVMVLLFTAAVSGLCGGYLALKVKPAFVMNYKCCDVGTFSNLLLSLKVTIGLIDFHSQSGQDKWIVYRIYPGVENGYFVDVGSADGVRLSNTKVLEELGWTGICIDPFPKNMQSRTCTMLKEVVDSEPGRRIQFRAGGGDLGGIDEHLRDWVKDGSLKQAKVVELTTTTLEAILARANAPSFIHYLSIDIEGAELAALTAFPWSKHKVGAFTIEHNYEEPKRSQIRTLLESNGYRLERSLRQDDFYVLERQTIE